MLTLNQQRIAFSNEVNAARLKVLLSRDEVLTSVKAVVANELGKIGETSSAGYKDILLKLTVQGLFQMMEPAVVVRVRQTDVSVMNSILKVGTLPYFWLTSITEQIESFFCAHAALHTHWGMGSASLGVRKGVFSYLLWTSIFVCAPSNWYACEDLVSSIILYRPIYFHSCWNACNISRMVLVSGSSL